MTSASSVAAPLCTWLVAATCMSVSADKNGPRLSGTSSSSLRLSKKWRKRGLSRCCGGGNGNGGGGGGRGLISSFCGSGINGLVSSCLAFEPCCEYYKGMSSPGFILGGGEGNFGLSSFFGPRNGDVGRRQRRMNRACRSVEAMAVAVQPAREMMKKKKPVTKQRRVVVTGMGVVTPLGHDANVFYNNLLDGVSGISEIETFDCAQFPTRIAGEIKSFSTDGWVSPKFSKRMDKFMLYILTAGKKALVDGGITDEVMEYLDKARCGVLIGSAMGGMKIFNDAIEALRISYRKMNPFCVPFATTNMGSAMLAMDLGWMGPNYSISTACATSNYCILNAANHIIRGEAIYENAMPMGEYEFVNFVFQHGPKERHPDLAKDVMLCGGSDAAIIPIGLGGFVACRALSQRNNDPAKASRPWDMRRDGFVMGEGAGVLLLEELEHAKKRGVEIYAEFLGGSFTCDAYHMTEPHPEGSGVILCIEKALSQSGVSREDVNYINAHATSTPAGDLKEYNALAHCFSHNKELKVNSTKSMIGHLLGASGGVEAAAVVQAIRTGWVHPNVNLENPDEGVDTGILVGSKKERLDVKVALSNSFGFGGHNSSILFAPYK